MNEKENQKRNMTRTVTETIEAPQRMNEIAHHFIDVLVNSKLSFAEGIMICEGVKNELIKKDPAEY